MKYCNNIFYVLNLVDLTLLIIPIQRIHKYDESNKTMKTRRFKMVDKIFT